MPDFDYLIIDEFYKLSSKRDDERSDSLNNAFRYILEKFNPKFYLLGPNIEGISEGFADKYNAIFYKTNYSLVGCDEIDIYQEHKGKFGAQGEKKKYKERVLFDLLYDLKEQNSIIYCSSPARARYLSVEFLKYLIEKRETPQNHDLSIIDCVCFAVCPKNLPTNSLLLATIKFKSFELSIIPFDEKFPDQASIHREGSEDWL